jgi:predicted transcriptional regulator
MRIGEHLSLFSIEDLRTLAERRGFMLPEAALKGRQTVVRALSGALERYESVYTAVGGLNRAEVEVLRQILTKTGSTGLSAVASALEVDASVVRTVLDSLRLWGLVFPEGDWEHLAVPAQTRMAHHYLPPPRKGKVVLELTPPELAVAKARCEPRPGVLGWDMAEFLARVARARLKLTQAGRINRRDLKSMEAGFAVVLAGYPVFLSTLVSALGLLDYGQELVLSTREEADLWLSQSEQTRGVTGLSGWTIMRGYAESATGDPAEADYLPMMLPLQRGRMLDVAKGLDLESTYTIASLHERLVWSTPASFQQWDAARDPSVVAGRMVRSLYWLGVLAVDDPERPRHFRLTPLGARLLRPDARDLPPAVPEDAQFFLQPNAEAFAPPNLAPRTLFHLRRITGEKKGGPLGVYPLTQDSLRRALDSGLSVDAMVTFLERYSRTGLPPNVRTLVETAGRQHGRIRLVPTGYVLVTDVPELLQELRQLKTIEPLVGDVITERVANVDTESVGALMRQLRQRGYAPLNEAEVGDVRALPDDPNAVPDPLDLAPLGARLLSLGEADWGDPDAAELPTVPGEPVTDPAAIYQLLLLAEEGGLEVEIEYHGATRGETTVRAVHPLEVGDVQLIAFCCLRQDTRVFNISRISSARLTGETFSDEYL